MHGMEETSYTCYNSTVIGVPRTPHFALKSVTMGTYGWRGGAVSDSILSSRLNAYTLSSFLAGVGYKSPKHEAHRWKHATTG